MPLRKKRRHTIRTATRNVSRNLVRVAARKNSPRHRQRQSKTLPPPPQGIVFHTAPVDPRRYTDTRVRVPSPPKGPADAACTNGPRKIPPRPRAARPASTIPAISAACAGRRSCPRSEERRVGKEGGTWRAGGERIQKEEG